MNSVQTINRITPEDDDLGQATIRELIVLLALAEEEHRNTANPGRIAALIRREQAIIVALHRNGLRPGTPDNPKSLGPSITAPIEDPVVK